MKDKLPPKIIRVKYASYSHSFIYSPKENTFEPLDESTLARYISGYTRLNERARKKALARFIKQCKTIRKVKLTDALPNAPANRKRKKQSSAERTEIAGALLSVCRLFEDPTVNLRLLADVLCGMHGSALHKVEADFQPVLAIKSTAPEVLGAVRAVVKAAVRKRWWGKRKRWSIRRDAILAYRTEPGDFPHHIQDFSQLKVPVKGYKSLRTPFPYKDTVALVIGADKAQIKEASPYLENAAVILFNSDPGELSPTKISTASISAYDPAVVSTLKKHRKEIASLLGWWWSLFNDEDTWARKIVQDARASFGKPDSRYIRVELDPKKLRDAIRYRVLLSFLDEVEDNEFMTSEELEPYRQSAKDVFDPAPPEPVVTRRAEDPEVFLEIMQALVSDKANSIVAEGDRFVKSDKPFGAWRTISKERHLVLLEETWSKEYAKAARSRKDIEGSFLNKENWERELQKILAEYGCIKQASSGYRYRYDLLENGSRDSTYVVAIPAHFLEK